MPLPSRANERIAAVGTRRRQPLWSRLCWLSALLLAGCNNNPYPPGATSENTLFNAFDGRSPRTLDPTASYSNNESVYSYQIYEPLYGYHYLKRPYQLIPKTARAVVQPYYLDSKGRRLPADAAADSIAESVHEVSIQPGILFAPHPAFAKDAQGNYFYHHLTGKALGDKRSPWEFEHRGTRELVADDYVYALKRHASPSIEAPVFGVFADYVIGLKEYGDTLRVANELLLKGLPDNLHDKPFLDLRQYPLAGVEAIDKHTLRIRIKGKYPQWKYWMAMPFVAPIPWEAEAFYAQPGMRDNGLSLSQWPVGTGPFMMTEYVQDRRHVMRRNPNFRGEPYPCDGEPEDKNAGLLADCGKRMPFVQAIVTNIEKEKVPHKEKFKQGYLDVPEIEDTNWGIAFRVEMDDSEDVRRVYEQRAFKFPRTTDISNAYLGFNWLDPVVGKGDTPEQQVRNRKLRQALSIAIDWEEGYTRIFRGRGEAAHGPLPKGLFGSRHGTVEGHNPVTHKVVDGIVVRRSIAEAKQLLTQAGYPDGRDVASGKPLVLNYDFGAALTPDVKPSLDWMVKQFAKLGVQLEVRATDYNQFQEKMNKGTYQIFTWGWLADYPDAENFLFLLYGPNARAKFGGENASNYSNPEYDRLYRTLQALDDGPEKQEIIDKMVTLLRTDAPWAWGYFPYVALAFQPWVFNGKPGLMIRDMAKYYRVDPTLRVQKQAEWNRPVWWPLLLLLGLALALALLARRNYTARERTTARPRLPTPETR